MRAALGRHWSEYLMEAAGLGLFMVSACVFGILFFHPGSPAAPLRGGPFLHRALMGVAMALTACGLIYSPWGKRSGAHFNPAVTLTFFRLGKVAAWDAVFYVVAHGPVADPSVHYVVTVPGTFGVAVAFIAETAIAFVLMAVVLLVSNTASLARFSGVCAGM